MKCVVKKTLYTLGILAVFFTAQSACAFTLDNERIDFSNQTAGAQSIQTIAFTATTPILSGDTLEISYPSGYNLTNLTNADIFVARNGALLPASDYTTSILGQTISVNFFTNYNSSDDFIIEIGTNTRRVINTQTLGETNLIIRDLFGSYTGEVKSIIIQDSSIYIGAKVQGPPVVNPGDNNSGGSGGSTRKTFTDDSCVTCNVLIANPEDVRGFLQVRGLSYPEAIVRVLIDGIFYDSVQSNSRGEFFFITTNLSDGDHVLTLIGNDILGRSSEAVNQNFTVRDGEYIFLDAIIIPPTLYLNYETIDESIEDEVLAFGYAIPNSQISLFVNGIFYQNVISDQDGRYQVRLEKNMLNNQITTVFAQNSYEDFVRQSTTQTIEKINEINQGDFLSVQKNPLFDVFLRNTPREDQSHTSTPYIVVGVFGILVGAVIYIMRYLYRKDDKYVSYYEK